MNTLDGPTRHATPKRPVTYSKPHTRLPRIIDSLDGSKKFREQKLAKSQNTLGRNILANQDQTYGSWETLSPTKRRKTEPQVIDFTAEEDLSQEVQEIQPRLDSTTPVVRRSGAAPQPVHSVRSQRSYDSGTLKTVKQSRSGFPSASRAVDDLVRSAKVRSKPQEYGVQQRTLFGRSKSRSATPNTQDSPIHVPDEGPTHRRYNKPKTLFEGFSQGEDKETARNHKVQDHEEIIKSRHFLEPRINENTADDEEKTTNIRERSGATTNVRNYRPANPKMTQVDPNEDDVDELQMDVVETRPKITKRQPLPSKASYTANKGEKRKIKVDQKKHAWLLLSARSHEFHAVRPVSREVDGPSLQLESGPEPNTWCIIEYDGVDPSGAVRSRITSKDVVKAYSDDEGRIRLEGPRQQDGSQSIVDLDFHETKDFRRFRDVHVPAFGLRHHITKDSGYMDKLFKAALVRNDKIGTCELVADSPVEDHGEGSSAAWPSKTPLFDQFRPAVRNTRPMPVLDTNQNDFAGVSTSTRLVRATRASAPVHDLAEIVQPNAVEKYSIVHGLGRKWLRPLTHVSERQRAVVNQDDLSRLDDEEMLNDSLIDFYMIHLFEKYGVPMDKVYFFNTYFFTKLTEKTGRASMNYKAVERWTQKIDVFGYDYVVVPINEGMHWYLAIICNIANIERKPLDSDDDVAKDSIEDVPEAVEQSVPGAEVAPSVEPQTHHPSNFSIFDAEVTQQEEGEDVNLFDEEAISLVNRDVIGPVGEEGELSRASSVPPTAHEDDQTAQAGASVAPEQDSAPVAVQSCLEPAKGTKKKLKRKPPVVRRDPSEPVIIILDSLSNGHSGTVRSLKDWLAAEGENRRAMTAVIKAKGLYPKGDQIPTQNNFSDCGVYMLGYVEKFFQDPDEFKRKLLVGEMTSEDDWPKLNVKEMRKGIRDVLFTMAEKHQLDMPLKSKKSAKTGAALKKVPTPPGSQSAIASSRSSPAKQLEPTRVVETKIELAKVASPQPNDVAIEDQPINGLPGLRLMSPFTPPRRDPSAPVAEVTFRKVSDSPPVFESHSKCDTASPSKQTPERKWGPEVRSERATASPQKQTPGRKWSPEVRIPGKTPNSHQLLIQGRDVHGETARANGVHQQAEMKASASPIKKRRQAIHDENEQPSLTWIAAFSRAPEPPRHAVHDGKNVRTPAPSKRAKSASAENKRPSSRASASLHNQRDGSSDQPIEIEDSQDVKSKATRSPRGSNTGSSAQRKTPSRTVQSLRHASSVEEIPSPSARKSPIKYRHEPQPIDAELIAQLDAGDRAVSRKRATSDPDAMDIDTDVQGTDPMEIDTEIRETPEAKCMSPKGKADWITGQALPH